MDIESIIEKSNKLHNQINEYLKILLENGDEDITFEKLSLIYCNIFKNNSLESENIIIFKVVLEQIYGMNFESEESLDRLILTINQCNEIRIKNKPNTGNINIEHMTGIEFENLTENLLIKMGLEVEKTKATGDGGIDLIAYSREALFEGKYIVQCKRWNGSIGEPIIRDLYGVVMSERANKGILITNSSFTSSALNFASDKPIELIDGIKLRQLLSKYNITNKEYANIIEDDELLYLRKELRNEPNNLSLRFKLACKLMEKINTYNEQEYLKKYISESIDHFKYMSDIKCSYKEKVLTFIKYYSYSNLGYLHNIQGEIAEAIKYYFKATNINIKTRVPLSSPKYIKTPNQWGGNEYSTSLNIFFITNVLNIITNMNYLRNNDVKNNLYFKHEERIDKFIYDNFINDGILTDAVEKYNNLSSKGNMIFKISPAYNYIYDGCNLNDLVKEDEDSAEYDAYQFSFELVDLKKDIILGKYKNIFKSTEEDKIKQKNIIESIYG